MQISRRLIHLDLLIGAVGLALVGVSLLGMVSASAAAPAGDGSDWGAQGLLTSDSAQTAQWDNTGNAADSVVPRNANQSLPHTAGKTYADISASDRAAFAAHYGADDGLGGLHVTVSQTSDLVNQAVTVSISGAKPDLPAGGAASNSYFQVFQCWGAMGSNGKPDPAATSPDPATCQVGAAGPDTVGGSAKREYRVVANDPLVRGGDWAKYDVSYPTTEVPFLAIDGTESGSNLANKNSFFNHTTTNEYSHVTLPASGATSRQIEMQTGVESQGLGCGYRADEPSTSSCWIVVVPRIQGYDDNLGPTSPSVWGERMQFKVGFQDVATSCASGSSLRSLVGSELLASAAASWIPGVCDKKSVALGYTRLGDEVARNQYSTGTGDAILTSSPIASSQSAVTVPLALTAPVIAYTIDYKPACKNPDQNITKVNSEADAKKCGYVDLDSLEADRAKAGQPIRDLRLTPLMVAKLITMSYQDTIIGCGGGCQYPVSQGTLPHWTVERPTALFADPDFRTLNPQLHLSIYDFSISDPILEASRSDAAAEMWTWLLADPAASSFLSGCPDADGVKINPFFSSRTYTGCQDQKSALDEQATADRKATKKPANFVDQAQIYPPDGAPYPLPGWQEQPATSNQTARTLVDQMPRVDNTQVGARDAFIGYKPSNTDWCPTTVDATCTPSPGKWKDPKTRQQVGDREVMSVTDSSSAARYQLPTAALCDDTGKTCVQANTASLQAAAAEFVSSPVAGFQQPAPAADYAGGAYPMTLPVYAVVRPSLPQTVRLQYADAFDFVTQAGQTPGYSQGTLPPGYAPLTSALTKDATAAIANLRVADPVKATASSSPKPTSSHTSKPHPSTSPSASASPSTSSSSGPGNTGSSTGSSNGPGTASSGGSPSAAPSAAGSTPPTVTAQTQPLAASTEKFHGWLLPLGVGLALGAGLAGPFLRRRNNVRLR